MKILLTPEDVPNRIPETEFTPKIFGVAVPLLELNYIYWFKIKLSLKISF